MADYSPVSGYINLQHFPGPGGCFHTAFHEYCNGARNHCNKLLAKIINSSGFKETTKVGKFSNDPFCIS